MRKSFRSTTAMMMAMALAIPHGAFAQNVPDALQRLAGSPDAPRVDGELQFCALEDPAPCILPDGSVARTDEDAAAVEYRRRDINLAQLVLEMDAGRGAQEAQAEAGDTDRPRRQPAEDRANDTTVPAEVEDAPEQTAGSEAEAEAEAERPRQADVSPEREAEPAQAEAEAEAEAEQPRQAEAEQPRQAEAEDAGREAEVQADQAEAEADSEAERPRQAEAPDVSEERETEPAQAQAEAEAADESREPEQEPAQGEAVAEAEQPRQAEAADGSGEREQEAQAEDDPDLADRLREQLDGEAGEVREQLDEAEADLRETLGLEAAETTEATDDAGLTDETAEREARRQAETQARADVAAAAEAEDGQVEGGEVVSETVDEEDVRRSDEDAVRRAEADPEGAEEREGMSSAERLALLGIGALVVGALLNNGDEVVSTSDDRAVVQRPDGTVYVLKDDDTILRRPGSQVETRRFDDGSTITTVTRPDGAEVRTVRDATGRVLRRTKVLPDGTSLELFDDTEVVEEVDVTRLPRAPAPEVELSSGQDLEAALRQEPAVDIDRRFSLGQVRNIRAVRELVPMIDLDTITFDTGSAAIRASEAEELVTLGQAMQGLLDENPGEVFLIEGHTDAVGSATSNLSLSDRRAESLALALTEYFEIPPENMVVQGYGESYLKVATLSGERENRRVAVRRITPLLTASVN